MIINKITLNNFRIYKGENSIDLSSSGDKNINIIAGKNGFGKTTFLTSLIWCFYGKLMTHVEEKYKRDIWNAGGYNNYLENILNRTVNHESAEHKFTVKVELTDIFIPTIPCRTVSIERTYNLSSKNEELQILIDGDENELTKEVGYEVFVNDFILPREIAKFFFFDAEKIVSLAEAKTVSELKSLSKAYSEVLGIKKYEDLRQSLQSLQTKLKRKGGTKYQQEELEHLLEKENNLNKRIQHNLDQQSDIDKTLTLLKQRSDSLQEKLIREGNSITLEELKGLKHKHKELQIESSRIKSRLKDLLDLAPFVIAGKHLRLLNQQISKEYDTQFNSINKEEIKREVLAITSKIGTKIKNLDLQEPLRLELKSIISDIINESFQEEEDSNNNGPVLLEFTEEQTRKFKAVYNNIKTTYLEAFKRIVKEEKTNRSLLARSLNKIKEAEARKDNPLAIQFRGEKVKVELQIKGLEEDKEKLIEELGGLRNELASHKKVLSEYEKNLNLISDDQRKFEVIQSLLQKVNELILRIKKEKKFSLQRAIGSGLKKLMHKESLVSDVRVIIMEDTMDVELLNDTGEVIDKDSLSKGEQQLYATALLKALVDESGIHFPVFIDSPLQKFDKIHSKNIITEFYPSISDQVVIFPLLEKELSEHEYDMLRGRLNKTFLIHNEDNNSTLVEVPINQLFLEFKKEKDVYTYQDK